VSIIIPALRRPIIVWDVVLSILLTALGLGIAALVSLSSIFLVMAADSCGGNRECTLPQLTAGWLIAMIGPSVIMLVTLVLTVVSLVRRRVTWWLPLTGIVVELLVWWGAVSLVFASVPGLN
jgi:predicted membrane protein